MNIASQSLSRHRFKFPRNPFELFRSADTATLKLTTIAVFIAWIPPFVLSALHGWTFMRAFLLDFGAQSRILVVIPLLILTEPLLAALLSGIARHFPTADLIDKADAARFDETIACFERRGKSPVARIVVLSLVYFLDALIIHFLSPGQLPFWCYWEGGPGGLSTAGLWYVLISSPILMYLVLHWIWRQIAWTLFLRKVAKMDLRLIPSHPDLMGGLSFIETSIRGYLPFCFALGTIAAGGVANHMMRFHQPLSAFKHVPLVVIALALPICLGPLSTLFGILVAARRRGIFEYGSLANRLGHQFEGKWLNRDVDVSILNASDFSATIDLFSVVGNVRQMNFFPVGLQSVLRLVVAALAPAVPIALVTIPFDVLVEGVIKFLA